MLRRKINSQTSSLVQWWLLICCGLILVMVILGGTTRLTQSGLSMVQWQPLSLLPPLDEKQWQDAFIQYQKFPEYKFKTSYISLERFKEIFWLEYTHRLTGRIIGVCFFAPLSWFYITHQIDRSLALRLISLFCLGGLQGVIGWLMVSSGLLERPDVSQYYLTVHLGLTLLIYGLLLWVTLGTIQQRKSLATINCETKWSVFIVLILVVITLLSGGFVAGLDAGFIYNTFPLMGNNLIPDNLLILDPWYINLFENLETVQLQHRVLALTTLGYCIFLWRLRSKRKDGRLKFPRSFYLSLKVLVISASFQTAIGILTLIFIVPIPLALIHQISAFWLLTSAILVLHTMLVQDKRISK